MESSPLFGTSTRKLADLSGSNASGWEFCIEFKVRPCDCHADIFRKLLSGYAALYGEDITVDHQVLDFTVSHAEKE